MADHISFFTTKETQQALAGLSQRLIHFTNLEEDSTGSNGLTQILIEAIPVILNSADHLDEFCQVTIQMQGKHIWSVINTPIDIGNRRGVLEAALAVFYRVLTEFDITSGRTAHEFSRLRSYPVNNSDKLSASTLQEIDHVDRWFPVQILKRFLADKDIAGFRSVSKYKDDVDKKFADWEASLSQHELRVAAFQSNLDTVEEGTNFVKLHQGFNRLSKVKKTELFWIRCAMVAFGSLAIAPALIELWYLFSLQDVIGNKSKILLGATALAALTTSFLLIYFFRIALRSADSVKAQILQIEVRKTLCEFIQGYAMYAKEVKVQAPGALDKFESIIFSGIVANEDKLPSAFDGVDQLANLFKSIKSKAS